MLPAEIFYWGFSFLKGSLRDVFISRSPLKGQHLKFNIRNVKKNQIPTPQKVSCVFNYAGQVVDLFQGNIRLNTPCVENEEFRYINSYNTRRIHMGHARTQAVTRPFLTPKAGN
jgi:hypothetical protein